MKVNSSLINFQEYTVTNNLKRNGGKLDEVRIMEKVLRQLDPKFEHIVNVIEKTKDLETGDGVTCWITTII